MVEYNEDVIINAPYKLTLKNTDAWWVELRCLQNPNGYDWPGILEVNNHIKCLRDISAYGGALMTTSTPGRGGGAVQMGHGFERTDDPPRINLTDDNYHTLYITAGSSKYVGADAVLANIKARNVLAAGGSSSGPGFWFGSYGPSGYFGGSLGIGLNSSEQLVLNAGNGGIVSAIAGTLSAILDDGNGNILPKQADAGNVGSSGSYWHAVWANYLCYHTSYAYYFDDYDDLAIVKLWGEKTAKLPDNYDATKTKPPAKDPFAILKSVNEKGEVAGDFFDVEKMHSFALGCTKALAKKQDEQDALLLKLLNEVESLHSEIVTLKNA